MSADDASAYDAVRATCIHCTFARRRAIGSAMKVRTLASTQTMGAVAPRKRLSLNVARHIERGDGTDTAYVEVDGAALPARTFQMIPSDSVGRNAIRAIDPRYDDVETDAPTRRILCATSFTADTFMATP